MKIFFLSAARLRRNGLRDLHGGFIAYDKRKFGEFHVIRSRRKRRTRTIEAKRAHFAPVDRKFFLCRGKRQYHFVPSHDAIVEYGSDHKRIFVRIVIIYGRAYVHRPEICCRFVRGKSRVVGDIHPERERAFIRIGNRLNVVIAVERKHFHESAPAVFGATVRRSLHIADRFVRHGEILRVGNGEQNVCRIGEHRHARFVGNGERKRSEFQIARAVGNGASRSVQTDTVYAFPVYIALFRRSGKRKQNFVPAHAAIIEQRRNFKRIFMRVAALVLRLRTDVHDKRPFHRFVSVQRRFVRKIHPERQRALTRRVNLTRVVSLIQRENRKHSAPTRAAVRRCFFTAYGLRGGGHI